MHDDLMDDNNKKSYAMTTKKSSLEKIRDERLANLLIQNDFNFKEVSSVLNVSEKDVKQRAGKDSVQKFIARKVGIASENAGVGIEFLLSHLREIVMANVKDIVDNQGVVKHPKDWPEVWGRMCTSYKINDEGLIDAKFMSRIDAVKLLGQHIKVGAWKDSTKKIEITTSSMKDLIDAEKRFKRLNESEDGGDIVDADFEDVEG